MTLASISNTFSLTAVFEFCLKTTIIIATNAAINSTCYCTTFYIQLISSFLTVPVSIFVYYILHSTDQLFPDCPYFISPPGLVKDLWLPGSCSLEWNTRQSATTDTAEHCMKAYLITVCWYISCTRFNTLCSGLH